MQNPLWSPHGFASYRERYPATPDLGALVRADHTAEFVELWSRATLRAPIGVQFILVRGLFGAWIPGHFSDPVDALEHAGVASIIARSSAAGSIETNAALIARDVDRRVPSADRLIFLCHS